MGWPKGKPRTKQPVATPEAEARTPLQARKSGPGRWSLKAGANWETSESNVPEGIDRYHIPREEIPEGFDLQWVTVSVMGQPTDKERGHFERKGWTPVHQEDFDGRFDGRWMTKGQHGEINEGGQVLMARPLEISIKARKREQQLARDQIRIKEQALYAGDTGVSGADHPSARKFNSINRSIERISVPED